MDDSFYSRSYTLRTTLDPEDEGAWAWSARVEREGIVGWGSGADEGEAIARAMTNWREERRKAGERDEP